MIQQDKENEAPMMGLDLSLKKDKPRPHTDRNNSLQGSGLKQSGVSDAISLLEKKKQYSIALREKNKKVKEDSEQTKNGCGVLGVRNANSSNKALETNSQYFHSQRTEKQQKNVNTTIKLQTQHNSKVLSEKQKSASKGFQGKEKPKVRDIKREKSKVQRLQTTEPLQGGFQSNMSLLSQSNHFSGPTDSAMNIDLSVIKLNDYSMIERKPQLQISFKEVQHKIEPSKEDQKEVETLRKHNATFKKELANFRRESGSAKRQVQALKKQIAVLTERSEFLEGQNADHIKLLDILQKKNIQVSPPQLSTSKVSSAKSSPANDSKMKEILSSYENDLFEATSLNKKLQFRNYMLQKRLADQTEIHRKQMAKEISSWKERYIRARNQNLRLKDSRGSFLLEMSMSREE